MAYVSKDADGNITGWFGCPQPDSKDADGNIIARGIPTVEMADDDPLVVAYLNRTVAPQKDGAAQQVVNLLVEKNVITAQDASTLTLYQGPSTTAATT